MVCDALATGRQAILLRKGGIHEGRAGFSFAHDSFFLFPTRFHARPDQIREGSVEAKPEWQPGDSVEITHHAEALWAVTLTDWEKISSLEPFHIYSETTVRERFDWEGKGMASGGIHVAFVRVRKLAEPWILEYAPKYGGCRSWVAFPDAPADWREASTPVLDDDAFSALQDRLQTRIA